MLKKIGLIVLLSAVLTSISYAQAGEWSIIPKLKGGCGEISELDEEADYNPVGISTDFLYGAGDHLEVGVGIGIDYNMFDGDKEDFPLTPGITYLSDYDEDFDFASFQLYGIARYNFFTWTLRPYISGKVGVNFGRMEYKYPDSSTEEIETSGHFGLAVGTEYKRVNIELGYEYTRVQYTYETTFIGDFEESGVYDVIYLAVGYRF